MAELISKHCIMIQITKDYTMNNTMKITISDLQKQYEALYSEHLSIGGQSILDNLLAFQRVLRFYMDEEQFDTYMRSL